MSARTTNTVFEQEFLPIRAKLLEVAASLDRIGRADGPPTDDPRMANIARAIEALLQPDDDRVEQIQLLFSLPYDPQWQEEFQPVR